MSTSLPLTQQLLSLCDLLPQEGTIRLTTNDVALRSLTPTNRQVTAVYGSGAWAIAGRMKPCQAWCFAGVSWQQLDTECTWWTLHHLGMSDLIGCYSYCG